MKTYIKNLFLLPALIAGLGLIPAGRVTAQNFTNLHDFTVAQNGCLLLNSSGIIVAEHGAAPPVNFVNRATARGTPWSGDQSLHLFDNALDHTVLHVHTELSLFEFHLHDSMSIPASILETTHQPPVHPAIEGVQT
jgi:hypothetical protein